MTFLQSVKNVMVTIGLICSTLWGGFIVMDNFVISKAKTVVEPVKARVETMAAYDKLLHESIEREIIMIRHYQQDNNRLLKKLNK